MTTSFVHASPADSPITDADLSAIRAELPLTTRTAYLNAGMLGPLTTRAHDAVAAELRFDLESRHKPALWERLAAHQRGARGAVATLTGIAVEHVALTHTTHEAINLCLWGMPITDGRPSSVVTTTEEHPGLLVPLRHLRDRFGTQIRVAAWDQDDDVFVANVRAQTDGTTVAVAISHVSWITGRIAPLRALRDALPAGVRLIVDGAQGAGVLAVDPADGWDAYTVSGQKWSCAPNGSGGLAVADPRAWTPSFGAFLQVTDPLDSLGSPLVTSAAKLESSQEATAPLAGLAASVEWLTSEVGLWRAHKHARALNVHARARLDGLVHDADVHGHDHLLCVDLPHDSAAALVLELAQRDVAVRALGAARIRVSLGSWNSCEDVDAFVDGLRAHLVNQR